ncbi:hypothetical protein INS61_26400 [Raoultella ornithinolytica]|nr:hypothetical protein [Raoultella ornithinolytica]MCF6656921.1 hypothetical protein [Raoultella ornithinolytica]
MFAGKKSAQIREILISESAWEEMTCLFAPSLGNALLRAAEDITREHPDINKLTFYQHQADAVLIEFEFTRSLAKAKVFRLASDKAPGERLVFDIYYG